MIGFFRKLLKDRRGNVLAIACAAMPVVVGCAGLATDTIQWTLWKRQLQRAADSAAIAGVYDRQGASGATTTTSATVSHDLTINDHTWMSLMTGYPQVDFPADSGVKKDQVHVTLAIQQRLPFSSLFLASAPIITASATAAAVPAGGNACVQALETSASNTGILINGNADIYMPDCVMYSNSPAANSAYAKGSSAVNAEAVTAVGGIQESSNWTVNAYRPYSPTLPDPFANVTPSPSDMKCAGHLATTGHTVSWVNDVLTDTTDMVAAKDALGNPAKCWTSMNVGSNTTLNVPAAYTATHGSSIYINGGNATIQGNFGCTACTIVLTNSDTSPNATVGTLKVNASSNINMTAPTSGTFKGLAIYQDRRAATCTNASCSDTINGNSGSVIQGALYFPAQELQYNGTGNTTAVCTMFVARRVNFTGNSTTSNKFQDLAQCAAYGLGGNNAVWMVRLVA